MRSFTVMFALAALLAVSPAAVAQEPATPDPEAEAAELRAQLEEIEGRLDEVEMKSAKDRVNFNGDLRVEAHSIATQIPAHFDGMMLQNLMVNTMFYYGANGQFPPSLDAVGTFIAQNYADYLYFTRQPHLRRSPAGAGDVPARDAAGAVRSSCCRRPRSTRTTGDNSADVHHPTAPRHRRQGLRQRQVHGPPVDVQDLG